MRAFFSTGEASGELLAADLLGALRRRVAVKAEGIGDDRLAAAGVHIVQRTRGWATLGIVEALRNIPRLGLASIRLALHVRTTAPDFVVLIDFGAFNVRFAWLLRRFGFRNPIVYYAPPAAWLDNPVRARQVAALCDPLTIFRHQAEFYRSLHLPIGYVGHPLVSTIEARPPRPPAAAGGGTIALLPGSRAGEIERHTPRLLDALARVREVRPGVQAVIVAANDDAQRHIEHLLAFRSPLPVTLARDTRAVLRDADAAAIASGTAVLEAALIETPAVALYVLGEAQAKIARRIYRGRFITIPNLVLDEPVVPELVQEAATPAALADALLALLDAPQAQREGYARARAALGPHDALQRNADWVLATVAEHRVPAARALAAGTF